jgi:hypothetical protein
MTNSCGEITYVYSSTPSSNQIYGVTSIDVTNAPAQHYTNLDAANLIFAENYTHPGITTNLLVFGSSQDGIYFVSPPYDWFNQAGQNINVASGSPTYWDLSVAGGYFYAPNPPIPPSSYTIYPGGTALFRTNNPTCWSLYQSNAWRFYMATNVALAPFPFETITTTGLVSQMFYVTNVSVFPNSNTVYTASDGSSVVFNEAPVGFTTILGVTWNQIPAPTNIIYVVTPPMSAPPTPPTTPTPSPIGGGNHYVMAQVSGVWKYLPEGNEYITQVGNMNLDQGRLSIPPKYPLSYLLIDSGGNASLIIKGRTSAYLSWLDWNPQIPSDAFYPYVNSAPSINTGVRGLYSN